jgi:hypothetical protein
MIPWHPGGFGNWQDHGLGRGKKDTELDFQEHRRSMREPVSTTETVKNISAGDRTAEDAHQIWYVRTRDSSKLRSPPAPLQHVHPLPRPLSRE